MSKTNCEEGYELKKAGKYWLIGRVGERFKRCPVLTSAKEVKLYENILVADDIIFEIEEDEAGEVVLLKIEDTPVLDKQQSIGDNQENATGTLQQKAVACEQGDNSGQQVVRAKTLSTRKNEKPAMNNTKQKSSESSPSNNKKTTKRNVKSVSSERKMSFPVTIIHEQETSDRIKENDDIDDSNNSKCCHASFLYDSQSSSQNEKRKTAPGQSFPDKSASDIPKEIEGFKRSDKDELEMGQTEDDYDSLEAGHTEETSMIQTIFVNGVTGTDTSKSASATDGAIDSTDEIKLMNEMVWKVILARHSEELGEMKAQFLDTKYTDCTLFVTAAGNSKESEKQLRIFRRFIEKFNNKEYSEVPVESADEVSTWCDEIERTLMYECCLYVPGQERVVIYCNTYEDCMRVKHLLLLKCGKIKASGRGKTHYPLESEQCLVEPLDSARVFSNTAEKDKGHVKSFTTNENIKVYIYQADILSLNVDCIISASNSNLQHGGGIAVDIARAAGVDLTREGNQYVKKYGPIPTGNVCTTTAGKLPYSFVIHAIGPRWSDYSPHTDDLVKRCETDLYNAVFNSFVEAERRGAKSIAFPAISSNIFGVPEDLCAYIYTKAILDYSSKAVLLSNILSEIHFVDRNVHILQQVCKLSQSVLLSGCLQEYDRSKCTKSVATSADVKTLQNESEVKSTSLDNLKSTFLWNEDARNVRTYKTSEMLQVYVYEANILKLPVDCIVNAANDRLQHGGGVASVIARAAGKSLLDECSKFITFCGPIPSGQTCVTTAGNLPYYCVIHAPCPQWSDYRPHTIDQVRRCENDLYNVVYNSFLQAEERELRSIALPAISSAIFGVPEEVCVCQYVKATVDYSRKSVGSSHVLSEIHFIDRSPTIVKKIQEAFAMVVKEVRKYPNDTSLFEISRSGPQQMNQVFQPGGGAGYFVPTTNLFGPTQMIAGPRWQTVRPIGQPGGSGGPGALQQMRASTMTARLNTGQSIAQACPGMNMPESTMLEKTQQLQALTMPQGARPGYSHFQNNSPQQQSQVIVVPGQDALIASMLAAAPPQEQKQMLGERLYPLIKRMYPDLAGKITGMLLEIDNSELLHMLGSPESLKAKVEEAVAVLQAHHAKETAAIQKATNDMKKQKNNKRITKEQ